MRMLMKYEEKCKQMSVCFNLVENSTAFVFPGKTNINSYYWFNDESTLYEIKSNILFVKDPFTDELTTTTYDNDVSNTISDQIKTNYITYFILSYMLLVLICIGIILVLQVRQIRCRCSYDLQCATDDYPLNVRNSSPILQSYTRIVDQCQMTIES